MCDDRLRWQVLCVQMRSSFCAEEACIVARANIEWIPLCRMYWGRQIVLTTCFFYGAYGQFVSVVIFHLR